MIMAQTPKATMPAKLTPFIPKQSTNGNVTTTATTRAATFPMRLPPKTRKATRRSLMNHMYAVSSESKTMGRSRYV